MNRTLSPLGAVLSYLVPGLGQICQGRVGKGVLFMVCIYLLFFYGMALGSWENVYLPDTAQNVKDSKMPAVITNLYNRLPFVGQFWVGVAAWPALYQYATYDDNNGEGGGLFGNFERAPKTEETVNKLQREGNKTWDLGWVYTVIAGVLNILVIYDALAGPAFAEAEQRQAYEEERRR
jgi:hypothetical protein